MLTHRSHRRAIRRIVLRDDTLPDLPADSTDPYACPCLDYPCQHCDPPE